VFEVLTWTPAYNNALSLPIELNSRYIIDIFLHFQNVKQIKNNIFTNTIIKKIRVLLYNELEVCFAMHIVKTKDNRAITWQNPFPSTVFWEFYALRWF